MHLKVKKSSSMAESEASIECSDGHAPMNQTTINDLNDDCVLEAFKYLNLEDLVNVADVCSRFRQNARSHFTRSSLKYSVEFHRHEDRHYSSYNQFRVLRIFGSSIKKIKLGKSMRNVPTQLIELLRLHCGVSGALDEFEICAYDGDFVMSSVLGQLKVLTFAGCTLTNDFLEMLPRWMPQLRELRFNSIRIAGSREQLPFLGDQPNFPKLEAIVFTNMRKYITKINNADVERILKSNPQLKSLHFDNCANIDDNIFQSIAILTPRIETLCYMIRSGLSRSLHERNAKYLGQLSYLKILKLVVDNSIVSRIRETRNLSLEYLHLDFGADLHRHISDLEFLRSLSKMNKLKKLGITALIFEESSDIFDLCCHFDELNEIYIGTYGVEKIPTDQLLGLIQNSNKLKTLHLECLDGKYIIGINSDLFMQIVNIVSKRPHKEHLKIVSYPSSLCCTVPRELMSAHNDSLALITSNQIY